MSSSLLRLYVLHLAIQFKMVLLSFLAPLLVIPVATAQLNELAQEAGKKYFGTATDNDELSNSTYYSILTDTREFGQLTPANGQKVRVASFPPWYTRDMY